MAPLTIYLVSFGAIASIARGGAVTDWKKQSTIVNADEECQPYWYPPDSSIMKNYPPNWRTANLQFSTVTQEALKTYDYLSKTGNWPDIAPRGTRYGNWSGVNYPYGQDPDCWWTGTTCTKPKHANLDSDTTKCPEPHTLGFSLDDGPNCSHNAFYDYLNEINQKATLFYIGSNVINWPVQAIRGLQEGHEICVHTWSHPYMTSLTNEEAFAELYFTQKIITEVLGITVQCWRPPFGDVDDRIRAIAQSLGLKTIVWSFDTNDWNAAVIGVDTVQHRYDTLVSNAKSGNYNTFGPIILSHELNNVTMSLSQKNLPAIRDAFSDVVPIGTCLNWTHPYVQEEYVYPDFAQYHQGTRTVQIPDFPTPSGNKILIYSDNQVSVLGYTPSASPTKPVSQRRHVKLD